MRLDGLLHAADLHFGEHDPALLDRLLAAVDEFKPQLVVISGDLTKRARSREFRQARAFLDLLTVPHLVVPGNHDIPLLSMRRLFSPYGKYQRLLANLLEPEMKFDNVLVSGLNTTVNWRWKEGWLRRARREVGRSGDRLAVFVAHHPLARTLNRRLSPQQEVILLHGHAHAASARLHGQVLAVGAGSASSPRIREAHNGFNLLELHDRTVTIYNHTLLAHAHDRVGEHRFRPAGGVWREL